MIAGLRGIVAGKDEDAVLLDVGGVIYRVGTSTTTLSELGAVGDPAELRTHLVVREDQLALFGFLTAEELTFFDVLIGVTGIGPRIACAVLSTFKPDALFAALRAGDVALLATVPGIGRKTAARMIVDLRGKLPEEMTGFAPRTDDRDVVEALKALGYSAQEIQQAMSAAVFEPGMTAEEKTFAALQQLAER
jgi:Holliday junction DNA helicase RuvA